MVDYSNMVAERDRLMEKLKDVDPVANLLDYQLIHDQVEKLNIQIQNYEKLSIEETDRTRRLKMERSQGWVGNAIALTGSLLGAFATVWTASAALDVDKNKLIHQKVLTIGNNMRDFFFKSKPKH